MTPTPTLDRIRRDEKVIELRKQPRWIQRMQAQGLPVQDRTIYLRRPGGDAA